MLAVFILLSGLVIMEELPPLEEPKENPVPIQKCEHGFVHIRLAYYNDVEVWVHVQDRKTGKLVGCNDI